MGFDDRPEIKIIDNKGNVGMGMGMDPDGRSGLLLRSLNGPGRIELQAGLGLDSDPSLFLVGRDNQVYQLQRRTDGGTKSRP